MPERKGRRRKPVRSARSGAAPATTREAGAAPRPGPVPTPPSRDAATPELRVRFSAAFVAVLTLVLAALTIAQPLTGDHSVAGAVLLVAVGIVLLLIALVLAVLAAVPGRVASRLRRGERR